MPDSAIYPYPEHWELTTLGQLCSDRGGGIQTGPFGSQLHAADYVDTGIPSIMPKNISVEGVSTDDIAFIATEDAQRLSKYLVKEGDIVYSRRGDVEKCSLITAKEEGWLCGTGCLKVTLGESSKVPPSYVHAYLSHPAIREWISRHAIGATMPNLNTSILSAVPVLVPSKKEIEVIINVWEDITDRIVINRQTNQTLEQIAQAIFKSWFVDFEPSRAKIAARKAFNSLSLRERAGVREQDYIERAAMTAISGKTLVELDQLSEVRQQQLKTTAALFPDALVDSELGEIPEGWAFGTLDDLCDLNAKSWTQRNAPSEVCYVDLANTKNGVIEDTQYYSWENAPSRARRIAMEGDTIVGTVRPGNRSFALIGPSELPLTASTGFAVLSPKKRECLEFIYIAATSDENIDRLAHLADGGAYPAVRPDVVTQLDVILPNNHVMKAFSDLVLPLFQKRNGNLSMQGKLTTLRDTLLPKLLSGELTCDNPHSREDAVA